MGGGKQQAKGLSECIDNDEVWQALLNHSFLLSLSLQKGAEEFSLNQVTC